LLLLLLFIFFEKETPAVVTTSYCEQRNAWCVFLACLAAALPFLLLMPHSTVVRFVVEPVGNGRLAGLDFQPLKFDYMDKL
jgi:hypothetical protein